MGMMVNLSFVHAGMLASMAGLCVAIHFGLRSQSTFAPLGWLTAALSCGTIGILILGFRSGTIGDLLIITLLVPASYLCAGQAVRAILGQRGQYRRLIGLIGGLTAVSFLLALLHVPFALQTLPFQLACGLAASENVFRLVQVRQKDVTDHLLIVGFGLLALLFFGRLAGYPLLFGSTAHYSVIRHSLYERTILTIAAFATPIVVFLLLGKVVGGVIATYRRRSERDSLTGLLNRQGFDQVIAGEAGIGGAVILCDIDHFKRVNDRYGHAVGDEVLRAFALSLERTGHRAGRMGGEEFALLLPGVSTADAAGIAEMVRLRFHAGASPGIAPDHRLSASFGVAEYDGGAVKHALIRADAALYLAKEQGRNRVIEATDQGARADDMSPSVRAA